MVDMKINILNVGRHVTMTKDQVKLTIDSSIAYRITNPIISHYVLGKCSIKKGNNTNRALSESSISSLRQVVGEFTLDRALSSRMEIADNAKKIVIDSLPKGIRVENIFIE